MAGAIPKALALALVAALLAGCTMGPGATLTETDDAAPTRPVVVAVIDSGANPYHGAFAAPPGSGVDAHLAAFPEARLLALATTGEFDARLEQDTDVWHTMQSNQLYAFSGTRLLGISISSREGQPLLLDTVGHGAGTSALVAREAPESLVLVIQIDGGGCLPGQTCPFLPDAAAAMRWAADQPWIDVISLSAGVPGDLPLQLTQDPEVAEYLEATALAHARGKLLVNSAGNTPTVSFLDYFNGPPWIIAVGGLLPNARGDSLEAGRFVDVVANYTDLAASHRSTEEYHAAAGTSYAAPIVAGTLARSIELVRGMLGTEATQALGPRAFRDALNASALRIDPGEWNPGNASLSDVGSLVLSAPVVSSPLQMGWGYVHGGLAEQIAARVVAAEAALPPEKEDTAAHQARVQLLRESYWS